MPDTDPDAATLDAMLGAWFKTAVRRQPEEWTDAEKEDMRLVLAAAREREGAALVEARARIAELEGRLAAWNIGAAAVMTKTTALAESARAQVIRQTQDTITALERLLADGLPKDPIDRADRERRLAELRAALAKETPE